MPVYSDYAEPMSQLELIRELRKKFKEEIVTKTMQLNCPAREISCLNFLWDKSNMTKEDIERFHRDHVECSIGFAKFDFNRDCALKRLTIDQKALELKEYRIYLKPQIHCTHPTENIHDNLKELAEKKEFGFHNPNSWINPHKDDEPGMLFNLRNTLQAHTDYRTYIYFFPRKDVRYFASWAGQEVKIDSGASANVIALECLAEHQLFEDLEEEANEIQFPAGEIIRTNLVLNVDVGLSNESKNPKPTKFIVTERRFLGVEVIMKSVDFLK